MQVGKPSDDYKSDPEGKPESTVSKAVRGGAKLAAQVTKLVVKESGILLLYMHCPVKKMHASMCVSTSQLVRMCMCVARERERKRERERGEEGD